MRRGLAGSMVSPMMQEERKRCGGDMTESERSVESMAHCGLDVVGSPTTIGVLLKSWNSFILAQLGSY
jgi:hypothetical protein